MKNGTAYAKRMSAAFTKIRAAQITPEIPELDLPMRQLAIGVLGLSCGGQVASRAVDRALDALVDWNEMRVCSPSGLNQATGNSVPEGVERCGELIRALQSIYDRENDMSLDRLKGMGRREARQYLESIDGLNEYSIATIVLWSLGGHAIPVHDRLLSALRSADLVHPEASRAEVQAFLERHVSAADAKAFCLLMDSYAPGAKSKSKRVAKKASRKKAVSKKKATAGKKS